MNHVKVEEYKDYKRDDLISIKREQGVFKFMWVAMRDDKPQWVTCYGPLGPHRQFRFFTVDRIKPLTKAKAKLMNNKNQ